MEIQFRRVLRVLAVNYGAPVKMLAKDLGISQATASNYLRGACLPSDTGWQALECMFGIDRWVLLGNFPNAEGQWVWDLLDVPRDLLVIEDDSVVYCLKRRNLVEAIQVLYRAGIDSVTARLIDHPSRLLAIASRKDALTYGELQAGRLSGRSVADWVRINFSDQQAVVAKSIESRVALRGSAVGNRSAKTAGAAEGSDSERFKELNPMVQVSQGCSVYDEVYRSNRRSEALQGIAGFDEIVQESPEMREERLRLMIDPDFEVIRPRKVVDGGITRWVVGQERVVDRDRVIVGKRAGLYGWTKYEREPASFASPEDFVKGLQKDILSKASIESCNSPGDEWAVKALEELKRSETLDTGVEVAGINTVKEFKEGTVMGEITSDAGVVAGAEMAPSVGFVMGSVPSKSTTPNKSSMKGKPRDEVFRDKMFVGDTIDKEAVSDALMSQILGESLAEDEGDKEEGASVKSNTGKPSVECTASSGAKKAGSSKGKPKSEKKSQDSELDPLAVLDAGCEECSEGFSDADEMDDSEDLDASIEKRRAVLKPINTQGSFEDYIKLKKAAFDEQLKRMEQMPVPMAGFKFDESRVRFDALSCMKGKYVIWMRTKGMVYRNIGFIEIVKKNHSLVIQGFWIEEEFRNPRLVERLIQVLMGNDPQAIIKIKVEYNDPALPILQQLGFMTQSATLTLCTPGVSKRLHEAERKVEAQSKQDKFVDLEF